jgi:hypothetical protein
MTQMSKNSLLNGKILFANNSHVALGVVYNITKYTFHVMKLITNAGDVTDLQRTK